MRPFLLTLFLTTPALAATTPSLPLPHRSFATEPLLVSLPYGNHRPITGANLEKLKRALRHQPVLVFLPQMGWAILWELDDQRAVLSPSLHQPQFHWTAGMFFQEWNSAGASFLPLVVQA